MTREGSPFKGTMTSQLKEAADHMTGARMHLIMLLVMLTATGAVLWRDRQDHRNDGRGPVSLSEATHSSA